MGTLSCGMHVGSSTPTRNATRAPCIGSVESYPLDHQGSPLILVNLNLNSYTQLVPTVLDGAALHDNG